MAKEKIELKYIPIEEVENTLQSDYYGICDLVELDLFPSEYTVRYAIQNGHLEFHKVNKSTMFLTRPAILKYWKRYRGKPRPPADQQLLFKITKEEKDGVEHLIAEANKALTEKLSLEDLFRNLIRYLCETHSRGAIDFEKGNVFKPNYGE